MHFDIFLFCIIMYHLAYQNWLQIIFSQGILLYLSVEVLISLKVFSENLSNYIKIFLSQV